MITHWLIYLVSLMGCAVFYWAYGEWFSWAAFVAVASSCVISLVLSLPGMLRLRLKTDLPAETLRGRHTQLHLLQRNKGVAPPYRIQLELENVMTGEKQTVFPGQMLPMGHCSKLILRAKKARVYDFLGLFFLSIPFEDQQCLVMPRPNRILDLPNLDQFLASSWKPKAGGGFSENHELREYRPGDNLNQVHWKLSAKTGDLIVREPMTPMDRRTLVDLSLRGTPDEIDQKLGALLWLGQKMLDSGLKFETRHQTGEGTVFRKIEKAEDLEDTIRWLLSQPLTEETEELPQEAASWYYRIGGGGHEM